MLLKWLFLLFVAWYISRAVGNLIRAASGGQNRVDQSQDTDNRDTDNRNRARTHEAASARPDTDERERDIEDAQFQDL
jgi:hypothetical protein